MNGNGDRLKELEGRIEVLEMANKMSSDILRQMHDYNTRQTENIIETVSGLLEVLQGIVAQAQK